MSYSFFRLTVPSVLPSDALPGVSADDQIIDDLITAIHAAINAFTETHDDLTYGDLIQAARCVVSDLTTEYLQEEADA